MNLVLASLKAVSCQKRLRYVAEDLISNKQKRIERKRRRQGHYKTLKLTFLQSFKVMVYDEHSSFGALKKVGK